MIPKKIYLRENELEDKLMCERMVSCDAAIGSCNVEYTDISSLWHDATTQPELNKWFLAQIGDDVFETFVMYVDKNQYWKNWSNDVNIKMWAYIDDLLPKGGKK